MIFNKHGSFYVRKSWPMKGLLAVKEDRAIFSPQNNLLAVDKLGIGRVMVTSLRYWMGAMKLTEEERDNSGRIIHKINELAETILEHDPLFQSIGTAYLLHRNLAKNKEEATSWYWFFNEFEKYSFDQNEFINDLKSYILINGKSVAESSLKRDYSCLIKTYEKEKIRDICDYIEDGIISYFSGLNLLGKEENGKYKKLAPSFDSLPDEILLYSILDDIKDDYLQININELCEKKTYVGKIYNLNYNYLLNKLESLEKKGYIKVYSRFGHNHIEIIENNKRKVLENFYRKGK